MITFNIPQSSSFNLFNNTFTHSAAVNVAFPDIKITHLLNLSITVKIESNLSSVVGKARIKSIIIIWKGAGGLSIGCIDLYDL